jgi:hypothetical protein
MFLVAVLPHISCIDSFPLQQLEVPLNQIEIGENKPSFFVLFALPNSFLGPFCCGSRVLFDPHALFVHIRKLRLRLGVLVLCSLLAPLRSVLELAKLVIQLSKKELSMHIALCLACAVDVIKTVVSVQLPSVEFLPWSNLYQMPVILDGSSATLLHASLPT